MGRYFPAQRESFASAAAQMVIPLAMMGIMLSPNFASAAGGSASAASVGLHVNSVNGRLMVVGVNSPSHPWGVRAGDQIVAVNGRKVSSEAAFMNRLSAKSTPSLVIARNNRLHNLNVSAPQIAARVGASPAGRGRGGGFMNPDLMVMTSQGVMHKEAAERLGLPGTPIEGSPEGSTGTPGVARVGASSTGRGVGGGFMNPDLMVMTSQGAMHKDAAERLGLPGTPIEGSPEGSTGTPGFFPRGGSAR
jgi:hypothetical protein